MWSGWTLIIWSIHFSLLSPLSYSLASCCVPPSNCTTIWCWIFLTNTVPMPRSLSFTLQGNMSVTLLHVLLLGDLFSFVKMLWEKKVRNRFPNNKKIKSCHTLRGGCFYNWGSSCVGDAPANHVLANPMIYLRMMYKRHLVGKPSPPISLTNKINF